jgi:hypothetical protein
VSRNLFVEASEVAKVKSQDTEVIAEINKTVKKGMTMKKSKAIVATSDKDKANTLATWKKIITAKRSFFKDDIMKDIEDQLFPLRARAEAGENLSGEVVTVPTLKWDSKTTEEYMEDVIHNAQTWKEFLEKSYSAVEAEVKRLEFAERELMAEASKPGITGFELYYLKPAVVQVEKDSKYPPQEFKAIDNSLSLQKSVAYLIRNVILERKNADLYTKKNAGRFQRDARDLRAEVNKSSNKKKLQKKAWKLGYELSR